MIVTRDVDQSQARSSFCLDELRSYCIWRKCCLITFMDHIPLLCILKQTGRSHAGHASSDCKSQWVMLIFKYLLTLQVTSNLIMFCLSVQFFTWGCSEATFSVFNEKSRNPLHTCVSVSCSPNADIMWKNPKWERGSVQCKSPDPPCFLKHAEISGGKSGCRAEIAIILIID